MVLWGGSVPVQGQTWSSGQGGERRAEFYSRELSLALGWKRGLGQGKMGSEESRSTAVMGRRDRELRLGGGSEGGAEGPGELNCKRRIGQTR